MYTPRGSKNYKNITIPRPPQKIYFVVKKQQKVLRVRNREGYATNAKNSATATLRYMLNVVQLLRCTTLAALLLKQQLLAHSKRNNVTNANSSNAHVMRYVVSFISNSSISV